jgi:hypothetical protein
MSRAIIVEPREHLALEKVLENVCDKLSIPITLVHGEKNVEFAQEAAKKCACVDVTAQVNADNLNATTYSRLLTDEIFWNNVGAEDNDNVLIFQTDSGICGDGKDFDKFKRWFQY